MANKKLVARKSITLAVNGKRTTIKAGNEFSCGSDEADSLITAGAATLAGKAKAAKKSTPKKEEKSDEGDKDEGKDAE